MGTPKFAQNKKLKLLCSGGKVEIDPENTIWEKTKKDHYQFVCCMVMEEKNIILFQGTIDPHQKREKNQKHYRAKIHDGYGNTVKNAKIVFK